MGNDESKSGVTKNSAPKKIVARLRKLGLNSEEIEHVFKLLLRQRSVSKFTIRDIWGHLLTPKLMDLYENYIVSHSIQMKEANSIDEITFSLFFSNFVKGTVEDRTNLLTELLHTKDKSILIDNIIEYSVELMKSVFRVMAVKNIDQYKIWSERGHDFTDDTIRRWALATVCNVCDPNEVNSISRDEMVSWITLNTDVVWLQCYLCHWLYEMETLKTHENEEHIGIQCPLPYLALTGRDDWTAIVDIPSVLFINSYLPIEHRYQWRLAYSVAIHGEGFTRLCSSICNRGPTVLIIKDKDDHIFGGYASTSWRIGPQFFGDEQSFLFSLKPNMKIHPALPRHNDHFLYLNANQKTLLNGLGMGGQPGYWGLWIDASFEFGSCSPSCSTYDDYKMLSGSPKFSINQLEVWCAEKNPKDVVDTSDDDSDSEKNQKSILKKDPAARVLLDMISKDRMVREYLDNAN